MFCSDYSSLLVTKIDGVVATGVSLLAISSNRELPKRSSSHVAAELRVSSSRDFRKMVKEIITHLFEQRAVQEKCSLSSIPILHVQMRLTASKLCQILCLFNGLYLTRSFLRHLTPCMSLITKLDFLSVQFVLSVHIVYV